MRLKENPKYFKKIVNLKTLKRLLGRRPRKEKQRDVHLPVCQNMICGTERESADLGHERACALWFVGHAALP